MSFGKILLFLENNQIHTLPKEADGDVKEVPLEMGSNLDLSRMWFTNNLVSGWQLAVNKFPLVTNSSARRETIDGSNPLQMEVFILNSIFKIITVMHDGLAIDQISSFI